MADLDLALVFTPDLWVEDLHRYLADHGGGRVLHLVVDPAMAVHERFDVLVVSWRWPALTRGLVDELHELGRSVIGVADRDELGAVDVLVACGVDAIVHSDAAPSEFVDELAALASSRVARVEHESRSVTSLTRRAHPWIVVCGPAGAGRSELALELARALPARLIDADVDAPSVAARLGLTLEPSVRTAIDAVEFGVGDAADAVHRVAGLRAGVVCGVPSAAAWAQIRPPELLRALHRLSLTAPLVIDIAPTVGDVSTASGDGRGRSAVARALLAEADAVVPVGLATPLGVVRLLAWLADAQRVRAGSSVYVVLNRSDRAAHRRAELSNELLRSYTPSALVHVPDDERVRTAGWQGALVARGPFTKAVAVVASMLATSVPEVVEVVAS